MRESSRRKFLITSGLLSISAGIGLAGCTQTDNSNSTAKLGNIFIHHVFFWLHNPNSENINKLKEGLLKLTAIDYFKMYHIGMPADTNREVIENSYNVSWMVVFKNKEDQDKYQIDPIHLEFVEQYSHLWEKVQVYDSVDI